MFSPKRVLLKSLKIWSSFPLWGIKIRKVEGGGEKTGSSHQTCPLFCLSTYSGRELTTSKDVDFVVNQPCLFQTYSSLLSKARSPFWDSGSEALFCPLHQAASSLLHGVPPIFERIPSWAASWPGQTPRALATVLHRPQVICPCHPGCPPRETHWNSLKIFHSELKAILSSIATAGGYVCVSGTFFFYGYSWHRTKSQCPRVCCQAAPLYLLLGKLIFEKKYRISNLVKWNVIYRAEIIPGFFFFNKCICFPNICSKSPLRTWVFISSSCILAILLRDLCHLYLSSIISILSFIFLFLYINIR